VVDYRLGFLGQFNIIPAESQKNEKIVRHGSHFWSTPVSILRQMDTPLSQTSVSLKLEEIKRRCEELDREPEGFLELSLEDADAGQDGSDPYNRVSFSRAD
jgi:hypothetical protein